MDISRFIDILNDVMKIDDKKSCRLTINELTRIPDLMLDSIDIAQVSIEIEGILGRDIQIEPFYEDIPIKELLLKI
nr:hypothetical protein [uncultured Desulfobulbus sp.]